MTMHVTNKEMASYIAGTLRPRVRERIESHIRGCGPCRVRHDALLAATAPRYRSLEAGDEVRERIMRSWREIANRDAARAGSGLRYLLVRRPGLAAASVFAAAAIILAIVTILVRGPENRRDASMIVGSAGQGVSIDGRTARPGDPVREGGAITLADGAAARIIYDDLLRIDLSGKGDLAVREFRLDAESGINFGITLRDGMLVSSVHAGGRAVSYEYLTPNARVTPLGTEFLLQAAGGATLVILREGGVRVTSTRTGKSTDLTAGGKCIIGDSIRIMKATAEDMSIFDDPEGLRAGKYARLLLPRVLEPDAPAGLSARTAGTENDTSMRERAAERKEAVGKRNAREESGREIMRQRTEENRIQMNEMRRNSRMNTNRQMRKGR